MSRKCAAFGCNSVSSRGSNISFHELPNNEERITKWLKNVKLKKQQYKGRIYICSLHFSHEDYNRGRSLKSNAVPHKNVLPPDDSAEETSEVSDLDIKEESDSESDQASPQADDMLTPQRLPYLVINPLPVKRNILVCRGCLATECFLYDLSSSGLDRSFLELTGCTRANGPLCYICLQLLRKFQSFRAQCRRVDAILTHIPVLTEESLSHINLEEFNHKFGEMKVFDINYYPHSSANKMEKVTLTRSEIVNSNLGVDDDVTDVKTELKTEINFDSNLIEIPIVFDGTDDKIDFKDNVSLNEDKDEEISVKSETYGDLNSFNNDDKNSDFEFESPKKPIHIDLKYKAVKERKRTYVRKTTIKKQIKIKQPTKTNSDKQTRKRKYIRSEEELACFNRNTGPLNIDQRIAIKMAYIFKYLVFRKNKGNTDSMDDVFDKIYIENIKYKNGESINVKQLEEWEVNQRKWIWNFLELSKRMADILNVDFNFVDLKEARKVVQLERGKEFSGGCGLCRQRFKNNDTLQRHVSSMHNPKRPYECEFCMYRFTSEQVLLSHILGQHFRTYTCRICKKELKFHAKAIWLRVKEHMSMHSGDTIICELCGKTFHKRKPYGMHLRNHQSAELVFRTCLLCGDQFYGAIGVFTHTIRIHLQAVQCSCSVFFKDAETMATHTQDGGGCVPGISPCPMCGLNYPTEELMMAHYDETHRKYKCLQCNETFETKELYETHTNTQCIPKRRRVPKKTGENKGEKTARRRRRNVKERESNSTQTRQYYMCEICGKSNFTCRALLVSHVFKHTGEKPFQCEICMKKFRLKQTLKIHMRVHTGERRYPCPHCDRVFRQDTHLRTHLLTHTLERPHGCSVCGRRFAQKINLTTHVLRVHEGHPPRIRNRKKTQNTRTQQTMF